MAHDWYKDAVIYQLHVRSYMDHDGDGIGDFAGLTRKLDYIVELGATAIWVLPFYPSPLRDDGYDIVDYFDVHPQYGTLEDFKTFLDQAHQRGLRVITELVINHTSDRHPWFQAARAAPPGSPAREFYVWSDTADRFAETRIIFTDKERSNWTWDATAKAFYWHRFYSHQPDLNHNNPAVVEEVIRVLRFWLDLGVDGLRLDAVPYLCVRDGTNNENLPETHAVIRRIRAEVDQHYSGRMLLAEANQWPADAVHYFGKGDECHMAFHFPLMPRIYLSLAQQVADPIKEILGRTPEIPRGCQWALFLRNHDELTLEMVSEQERLDLLYHYAPKPRMRLNLGIRRRLAPLLEHDRRKIELLNSLLLSLPGTPVIYYGDELGQGDDISLPDRDGVRLPMQWSGERNGGFSTADTEQLCLPANDDPVCGYAVLNVDNQRQPPSSLLNWFKRILDVRRGFRSFGRGSMEWLDPNRPSVLAYLRQYYEEKLLCLANLSPTPRSVELDLSRFEHCVPLDLLQGRRLTRVGRQPYCLNLPGHSFLWLQLVD